MQRNACNVCSVPVIRHRGRSRWIDDDGVTRDSRPEVQIEIPTVCKFFFSFFLSNILVILYTRYFRSRDRNYSFKAKLKRVKKSPFYDLPKTGDRYFLYHTCSRESIAQPNSSRPNVHLYRSGAYLYIHEWGCRELMRDRKGRESCVTRRHNYREYGYTRVLYIMNFKSVQLLRATLPLSLSLFDEIGRKVMVGV